MAEGATELPQETILGKKYEVAMELLGRPAMARVFLSSYQGHYPIRDYLKTLPDYNRGQYNRFFPEQRHKLEESPPDIGSFDITLLFSLLNLVCKNNYPDWDTARPQQASLNGLLTDVKKERNNIAHQPQHLTEQEFDKKLAILKDKVLAIYEVAATQFGWITSDEKDKLEDEVARQLALIKAKIREPLTIEDATQAQFVQLQKDLRIFRTKVLAIIDSNSSGEITSNLENMCSVNLVPWLDLNLKYKPSLCFMRIILSKEEVPGLLQTESDLAPVSMPMQEIQYINYLWTKTTGGVLPDVIVLTGVGGIGKTTLIKFTAETWIHDPEALPGLETVKLLLYMQCRSYGIRSYNELLKRLLPQTLKKSGATLDYFSDLISERSVLVLIDGYDEAAECSKQLVADILSQPGHNLRVVITTRPSSENHLRDLIQRSGKHPLYLIMKGIPPELHSQYISQLVDHLVPEDNRCRSIKDSVNLKLPQMKTEIGDWMNNPLTLTLMTIVGMRDPQRMASLVTVNDFFTEVMGLLRGRLVDRVTGKVSDPKGQIDKFLTYCDKIALKTLRTQEYDLSDETVDKLKLKCADLGLDQADVIDACFTVKRCRIELEPVQTVSFWHLRYQELAASRCAVRMLLRRSKTLGNVRHSACDLTVFSSSKQKQKGRFIRQSSWDKRRSQFFTPAPSDAESHPDHDNNPVEAILLDGCQGQENIWSRSNSTYQNVLWGITSVLATKNSQLLRECAQYIIPLIHTNRKSKFLLVDAYLQHVIVSRKDPTVVNLVADKLSNHKLWCIKEKCTIGLPCVIKTSTPDKVVFSLDDEPNQYPGLQEALVAISSRAKKTELLLNHHFFSASGGVSDTFLEALTRGTSTVDVFKGSLSSLTFLPDKLKYLGLRTKKGQLADIVKLPTFSRLTRLALRLEGEEIEHLMSSGLPPMSFVGEQLSLDLEYNLTGQDTHQIKKFAEFARDLLSTAQVKWREVGVLRTQLTSKGINYLLHHLHRHRIIKGLVLTVGTSRDLTSEETGRLKTKFTQFRGSYLQLHTGHGKD